ncbi:hypothetical protein [Nostoc sp.]|uniref:hypothetical protein n=1 Tax=Nostoc sp. TaxID=1180 RepID=UPI002FFB1A1D
MEKIYPRYLFLQADNVYTQVIDFSCNIPSSDLGVLSSNLGVSSSNLGVPSSDLGVRCSKLEVLSSDLGVPSSKLKVPSSDLGVPSSKLKVPSSESDRIQIYFSGCCLSYTAILLPVPKVITKNRKLVQHGGNKQTI